MTHPESNVTPMIPRRGLRRHTPALPHLVCAWALDPKTRRLSCSWAEPDEAPSWHRAASA